MFSTIKLIYFLLRPKTIFLKYFSSGLGDNLLLSALLPYFRGKYPNYKIVVETKWPELFENNPYPDWVTDKHLKTTKRHFKPKYRIDKTTTESLYSQFMQSVGVKGICTPEIYLSESELKQNFNKFPFPYIVVCPFGKGKFSANRKEWGFEKFQKIRYLLSDYQFVQIGIPSDKLLDNVHDARQFSIRDSAAVIRNALFFIGLEGGLMHVSRAVDKKAVIIFGGLIKPSISAYGENINIYNPVNCSPCFVSYKKHTNCDSMKCMKEITSELVYDKILGGLIHPK